MPMIPIHSKLQEDRSFNLALAARLDLLSVLTSSVEHGAKAFGLGERPAMNLALGAEELFLKLCADQPGLPLEVSVSQLATAVRLDVRLRGRDLDLRAFNLAAGLSPTDLDEIGLFLAARVVDDLQIQEEFGGVLRVSLIKQRVYPPPTGDLLPAPNAVDRVTVRAPSSEELVLFAQLQRSLDPQQRWESFLQVPGQLTDLVAGGEYHALCAFGPRSELVGGILWRLSGHSAEALGPFLFGQEELVAAALLEACVAALAHAQVMGLLFMDPPEPFPLGSAEVLGVWKALDGRPRSARFRLLQEDPGRVAWCDPTLEPWLRAQCARLFLPRDLRSVDTTAIRHVEHSVFFTRILKSQHRAELRPVRAGEDLVKNLEAHLARFTTEDLRDLRCTLDLGVSWHMGFAPALLEVGFEPRLLLPSRGHGDEVLFQKVGQ